MLSIAAQSPHCFIDKLLFSFINNFTLGGKQCYILRVIVR